MANSPAERRSFAWPVAVLLALTLVIRGAALFFMRGNLEGDPDAYREIAENLLRHGQFALGKGDEIWRTAYRPPLYPVVLSNLPAAGGREVSVVKVAGLHLLLGVGTVWLTWLTVRFTHPTIMPFVVGLVVACDPILLNQQSLVMTETLAAFLAVLSLWCLARFSFQRTWFNAAHAGGAIGLAVLSRPTFLPWLGLVGAGMLVIRGGPDLRFWISDFRLSEHAGKRRWLWFRGFGWRAANVAALGIGAAAVISPWAIRNYREFESPILATTHGGFTLNLANNPFFYSWLREPSDGLPWSDVEFRASETMAGFSTSPAWIGETFWDDWNYQRAKATIRERPVDFFLACLYRARQLWSPLPYQLTAGESAGRRMLRYATCAWYCGVYALAAIGVWRLRWKLMEPPWIWGVLLCVAFTGVHTFYWTNLRMRAPLMPFVAMVAAAGIVRRKGLGIRGIEQEVAENAERRQ